MKNFIFPKALLIYLQDHSKCVGIFQRSVSIQTLDLLQANHEAEKETFGHVTVDMSQANTGDTNRLKQVWLKDL